MSQFQHHHSSMKTTHLGLAVLVAVLWAMSFVAVKLGLRDIPPMAMSTVRLMMVSLPWIFFLPRPPVPMYRLAWYGIFMFTLYLGLLAFGIHLGIPAGLAALISQFHVLVTALLAVLIFKEIPNRWLIAGCVVSFAGLGIVALNLTSAADAVNNPWALLGFLLLLVGAAARGAANIISKSLGQVEIMALTAWGSFFAWPPLLIASLIWEGPLAIWQSFQTISYAGMGAIFYIAYFGTFLAFSLWSKLLHLYPATQIAPFTLLVPVIAMLLSAVVLDEPLSAWKLHATAWVLMGTVIAQFGPGIARYWGRSKMNCRAQKKCTKSQ